MVCGGLLLLLWGWIYFWPQTGDGDAICHFLIARDGVKYPGNLMPAWSRPAAMLPIIFPAQLGILAARWASAVVSVILAWQTMRLADDLKMRNAILAAPLLLMQPFAFALAGDIMTELPMALGLVIGIRLWWARRWAASALVISILPACRPEGFFFCAMWGFLFLGTQPMGPLWKRVLLSLNLAAGVLVWSLFCLYLRGHFDFLMTHAGWAWAPNSLATYGRGPFMTYIASWSFYCGPILLALFLLGVGPIWRKPLIWVSFAVLYIVQSYVSETFRENVLPWPMLAVLIAMAWVRRREKFAIAWWALMLVVTLHSVLWWRGWFASCGLLRIMACVSPLIACVCLSGWNLAADWLAKMGLGLTALRAIGAICVAGIIFTALEYYVEETMHYHIFGVRALSVYAKEHHTLDGVPAIIFRDWDSKAEMNMQPGEDHVLGVEIRRDLECNKLWKAPIGSAGFWDEQSGDDYAVAKLADLPTLGFTVLYRYSQTVTRPVARLLGKSDGVQEQTYVVIRKDSKGELPADVQPLP